MRREVGLAFDGTLDSVISDWDFNPHATRDIQVDVRYILWNMEKVGHADNLAARFFASIRRRGLRFMPRDRRFMPSRVGPPGRLR